MTHLNDSTLDHLREVVDLPDLTGTRYSIEAEVGRGGRAGKSIASPSP